MGLMKARWMAMVVGIGCVAAASWIALARSAELKLVRTRPVSGNFYSLQLSNQPPLPMNLFPELPLYSLGDNLFVIDDTEVDYVAFREAAALESLALMQLDGSGPPPPPGGGGGGTNGGSGITNGITVYGTNDLWLQFGITNGVAGFNLHLPSTNANAQFDLFGTTNLSLIVPGLNRTNWAYLLRTAAGQTNIAIPNLWPFAGFFQLASIVDTDGDGIPDAVERLVLHTSPTNADTDGDGTPDVQEDSDGDGLPDGWEAMNGLNPFASDATADPDGDGFSNFEEYMLGQNPRVADPARNTVSVTIADATMSEPGTDTGRFQLNRGGDITRSLTVHYRLGGTARNGVDYVRTTNEVTFPVGQSTAGVTITPVDDTDFEGSETVTLELSSGLQYLYGATASGSLTMQDDDKPGVSVYATDEEASEVNRATGTFEIRRTGSLATNLTVRFTLTGTATNGTDYDTLPVSVVLPPDVDATNLIVRPKVDGICEGTDVATLTLTADAAYQILPQGAATITIADADKPTVNVVATDADAREAGLNKGVLTFSRNGPTTESLIVYYTVGGSAVPSPVGTPVQDPTLPVSPPQADYTALSGVLVIPAGSASQTLDVSPLADAIPEPMEQIRVVLAGSVGYRIGTNNDAVVNLDDDEPLDYRWFVKRASAGDGVTVWYRSGVVEVVRTGTALQSTLVTVSVTGTNGVALPGGSYTLWGDMQNGKILFGANRSKAVLKIQCKTPSTVPMMQIRFASQVIPVPSWGADHLVKLEVKSTDDEALEGQSGAKATVRVSRSAGSSQALPVHLLLGGTATPGVDFDASTLTNVVIAAGTSYRDVEVYALPDSVTEGWESIILRLDTSDLSLVPHDPLQNLGQEFQETYGVVWLRENSTTGPRPKVDTDGDTLSDNYERTYSYDPLVADDVQADVDRDGLSLREEQLSGTNPQDADSDHDGAGDFQEITQGNLPNDPTSLPQAVPNGAPVECLVGDDSGSLSETWELIVGDQLVLNSASPGQIVRRVVTLEKGRSYPVRLRHVSSTSIPPDLDYHAELLSSGSPPPFFIQDTNHLLGSHSDPGDGPAYTNKIATLIVPKLELTWTNKTGNPALETNTDMASPTYALLPGGGMRIYVGATNATESSPRNTVMLKIKTTPVLTNQTVWLKAFDVDDASKDESLILDPNARAGDDNFDDSLATPNSGVFVSNGKPTNSVTLDANGEAAVEFKVGMQPGNNYRVAVTPFPTNNLASLQAQNPTAYSFVSAYTDTIRGGFNGELSPMLTVWRKLYLEFDSMQAPPTSGPEANFATGTVADYRPNFPTTGQSMLRLRTGGLLPDQYQNGTIQFPGKSSSFKVLGNRSYLDPESDVAVYLDFVTLDGLPGTQTIGGNATLWDDDDQYLSQVGLPPALPADTRSGECVNGIRAVFYPAFVKIEDANALGFNPANRRRLAFHLNEPANGSFNVSYFNDVKDVTDSPLFWAHTVVFGYQPAIGEDCDPDSEVGLLGGTPEWEVTYSTIGISVIYPEPIRDERWARTSLRAIQDPSRAEEARNLFLRQLYGTIAHEIGHAPGGQRFTADHAENELMYVDGPTLEPFAASSIHRFRTTAQWSK